MHCGGRRQGWLPIAAALLTLLGALIVPGRAGAAGRSLPPQGLYESCDLQDELEACDARLETIARAGFRVVLNYQQFQADRGHILAYAAAAESAGLKLVWPMKDSPWWKGSGLRAAYPPLARDCACASDDEFLRWVVRLVTGLPATWGYYVGDETPPRYATGVGRLSALVKRLDPVHPRLFVGDGSQIAASLSPFSGVADVLGGFVYPIGTQNPLSTVASVSAELTHLARRDQRPAVVLQAFSWGQYPEGTRFRALWPTRRQLRTERDRALEGGRPRLLLWYSYFDITRSDDPARHWRDLVSAAFG
jgi:hypothetical protein